jgi:hypothetical protein
MKKTLVFLAFTSTLAAQEGWWMREPIRWFQTNLREVDTSLDATHLAQQLADFQVNVVLFGMGGIVAHYPTNLEFHQRSPFLPPNRDTFGEMVKESHARKIRVVGRFDFSKTPKYVYDAHPEWFFRKADGSPVIYNGLYSTCINGGYYRDYAMRILAEALERYEVDGLFFNMFGNQSTDYSGRFVGHCHCDSCKERYRELYNRDLPKQPDEQYRQFLFRASREVAAEIGRLIREKRPHAGYFNYIQESTDGIMSESNTAIRRPLPLWPYMSSDNVNRARNSQPGKMSVNLCMQFVDFPWRFSMVPKGEIGIRLWQNVAQGGALAFAINGTIDGIQDRTAITAAKPIFQWVAANEQYYVGQQSAARVLLLKGPPRTGRSYSTDAYRGVFRFLSEQHIPFAVSENLDWIGKRDFDLVIATDWAPNELAPYLNNGGNLFVASPEAPEIFSDREKKTWTGLETYMRVRDKARFPSLQDVDLLMVHGTWTEMVGPKSPALTFVPPSMYGPPEKIHVDLKDTDRPGFYEEAYGKGKVVWVPWDVAAMYCRHSLDSHGLLMGDIVDNLLPGGRQIKTTAHPLVEISLMRQKGRTLLHLVNLSGHSQTAYFPPVPMQNIEIEVAGMFANARAVRESTALGTWREGKYTRISLPRLRDYELIVLE